MIRRLPGLVDSHVTELLESLLWMALMPLKK